MPVNFLIGLPFALAWETEACVKRDHLHPSCWASETSTLLYLPRNEYLSKIKQQISTNLIINEQIFFSKKIEAFTIIEREAIAPKQRWAAHLVVPPLYRLATIDSTCQLQLSFASSQLQEILHLKEPPKASHNNTPWRQKHSSSRAIK